MCSLLLAAILLNGMFARELSAQEFLGASVGRKAAIGIMSREISAAMTPWKIKGPVRKATEYSRHIWDASELYKVDPFLVAALVCVESEGRADAVSHSRVGLMQVNVQENMAWITRHFPKVKTVDDLLKARNNVMAGTFALSAAMGSSEDVRSALFKYLGTEDERQVGKILDVVGRMNTAVLARKK
jgi:soluble lytic murein transglycosylase-like protein